ncbi:MAG: cytochrome c [Desulfocapsa sp.]|nr:cytochrome c [Desulfocapsa sp.]
MLNTFRAEAVTLLAVYLILILLLTACSPPTGNAENGQRWFAMHNCTSCHGKNGTGGRAPKIAALNRSFGSFVRFLRNPDSTSMPRFPEEKISKQDAADIYIWLKTLPE